MHAWMVLWAVGSGYTTTPMTAWLKCTNRDDNRVGRGAGISIIGGGGADIHIFVFTDCKNNRFQKKLIGHFIDIPAPLRVGGFLLVIY
jgi:hypothetical protein